MLTSVNQLTTVLKSTGLKVYRDKATSTASYPFIVYSFVSRGKKYASGRVYKRSSEYQISLFTTGTEKDLKVIEQSFESNNIRYLPFSSLQGDENDDTVTNFYTYVKVVEDA
ncbi:hypothetical protein ACN9KL_05040 [Vagococcus fluvialis]|uniref:hypothetical protein n=1 Tax=Vagococcus fluvialis TaxID=2738 RepID=UPI003B225D93